MLRPSLLACRESRLRLPAAHHRHTQRYCQCVAAEIAQQQPYSMAADVWSLGVVLFAMLTGKPPFQADKVGLHLHWQAGCRASSSLTWHQLRRPLLPRCCPARAVAADSGLLTSQHLHPPSVPHATAVPVLSRQCMSYATAARDLSSRRTYCALLCLSLYPAGLASPVCNVGAPVQVAGTLERVRTAELQCPAHVGPQAADLLQRLLVKDPTQRLTLDAALRHPFVLQRRGGLAIRSPLGLRGGKPRGIHKEKDHIKGFAAQVAWVTRGSGEGCPRDIVHVLHWEQHE